MTSPRVSLLCGGGVGEEIVPHVIEIVERAGGRVDWHRIDVAPADGDSEEDLLDEAIRSVRSTKLALKTKFLTTDPRPSEDTPGFKRPINPNVELRQRLDLYIGVRPTRSIPGIASRYGDLDLMLIRENSEDIYKGIEHEIVPGVVQSLKVVTRKACERIARYAFGVAEKHGRRKLTFIHKGNIMKRSDGLFLETVRTVAGDHEDIEYRETIVDAACMQLVLDPHQFDVLLCGNLYGDILSSLAAGLAGGISTTSGINRNEDTYVFEAIHGDAPNLVGADLANPLPVLSPAVRLLHHLGQSEAGRCIETAVERVLEDPSKVTADLGGSASLSVMSEAIASAL